MSQFRTLRAGVFLPSFHPNDENPLLHNADIRRLKP